MTEPKPEYEVDVSEETWAKVEDVEFTLEEYTDHVGYTKVNHLLTICPLSDGAFRTYVLMRGLAMQGDGIRWGLEKLAVFRGVTRQTLSRHLSELCEMRLIERRRRVGTSSVTHFPALERIFPVLAAQCAATALWGKVKPDEDLKELVAAVGAAISPVVTKMIRRRNENDTTIVTKTLRKEEEAKKQKYKNSAAKSAAGEPPSEQPVREEADEDPLDGLGTAYKAKHPPVEAATPVDVPWLDWGGSAVRARNGISVMSLRRVGWLLEEATTLYPVQGTWRGWLKGLAQMYQAGRGDWKAIKAGIVAAWVRESRYRPTHPVGFVGEIQKAWAVQEQDVGAAAVQEV